MVTQKFKDAEGERMCPKVQFSPDGSRVAAGGERRTMVWELATGKRLAVLETGSTGPRFSADGKFMVLVPGRRGDGDLVE
ncbi:hypothetical protein NQP46_06475 [Streptomyces albus]|nr:hypothetical protein NQP46_06475 [Streptomyces albus]